MLLFFFLAFAALMSCSTKPAVITIRNAEGRIVQIPLSGRLSNDEGIRIAREIQDIDSSIKYWEESSKSSDPEILSAMLQMMFETRNDAVAKLELAYQIAQKTSGILDTFFLKQAKNSAKDVKKILNIQPPKSLYVETMISSSSSNAMIHYMSLGQFESSEKSWNSYTAGQNMRIGRYMFRVKYQEEIPAYDEILLIIEDPTVRKLTPMDLEQK